MTQDEMKELRDYFDGKFEGMEKRFDQCLDGVDKRFDGMDVRLELEAFEANIDEEVAAPA